MIKCVFNIYNKINKNGGNKLKLQTHLPLVN